MEWPSQNVQRGGILHPAKVHYNPETENFLKLLTQENNMTMMQRRKKDYFLRSGEPCQKSRSTSTLNKTKLPKVLIRPGSSKRRSYETIERSGVLEREQFIPRPSMDRNQEKIRLQNRMAFGKDVEKAPEKRKARKKPAEPFECNRFDQLTKEIKERQDWLDEMTALGQGKNYQSVIDLQIQERVREMNKLKCVEY